MTDRLALERDRDRFVQVLGKIAYGRVDNGRPLGAEIARQMAREVLVERGVFRWPREEIDQ